MKKIFTFFTLCLFATALFAQDANLTEVWHHSTRSTAQDVGGGTFLEGTPPSWMGNLTERGMVAANGKVYIASRNEGNKILILDPATGELATTIDLPAEDIAGGIYAINSLAATTSGNLVIGNLVVNTQGAEEDGSPAVNSSFKAYHIELNDTKDGIAKITNIVNWNNVGDTENPSFRIGDGITFHGDITENTNGYLAVAPAKSNYILRWKFTNGTADANPEIFQVATSNPAPKEGAAVNFNTAPQVTPVNDDLLIVDGNNLYPAVYDLASTDPKAVEMVTTFGAEVKPQTNNLNGCDYFEFKGRMFIVAVTNYWNAALEGVPINSFEVFELVDGDWAKAVSLGFVPSTGLSATNATKNVSFAYPASVDVQQDTAFIHVMSAKMGIARYALTIKVNSIDSKVIDDEVRIYPNPANSIINFSKEMASVKIYDLSSRLVKESINVSKLDVSSLRGLYIVNTIDVDGKLSTQKLIVQ